MILITGATGHIGNVLVRELIARGQKDIRVLLLPGENTTALEGQPVEQVRGDILNPDTLGPAFEGVEIVYHLAGMISILPGKDDLVWRVNVEGTQNVIAAAQKACVRRLVYTSSIHAIKRVPQGILMDETIPCDTESHFNDYDRSKAQATLEVLNACDCGLDAVIVCPTGVIGPHDYRGSEMGTLIRSMMRQRLNILIEGSYDFVDVRDVAQGLILAAEKGRAGEMYILSGEPISLEALSKLVQIELGTRGVCVKLPLNFARFIARLTPPFYRVLNLKPRFTLYSINTVAGNSTISHAKATRELGYQPRLLIDTIGDTVRWWRMHLSRQRTLRTGV